VLTDINLGEDVKWQIGHTSLESMELKRLRTINICDYLPSPGEPTTNGTIILTTSNDDDDRSQCTKRFVMPKEMEDKEAIELLEHASGFTNLQSCKPALSVVHALENVPTSVFW